MDEEEKRDRQMLELLNELRVALPGVQILFALPARRSRSPRASSAITPTQRTLFYASLLATAASTICLIAPSATHRLRFHQNDRTYIIESANKYMIAGLVFLGIAIVLAIATVTDFLYDGWIVWAAPADRARPRVALVPPPAAAHRVLRPVGERVHNGGRSARLARTIDDRRLEVDHIVILRPRHERHRCTVRLSAVPVVNARYGSR